jgi:hypothetical protein
MGKSSWRKIQPIPSLAAPSTFVHPEDTASAFDVFKGDQK